MLGLYCGRLYVCCRKIAGKSVEFMGRESHERGCVRIESAYITIWGQSLLGSKRLGHNVEAGCGRRLGGHKPER